jgi:TRAP-type mannitol/chloroaromatic compound transport system substrate-binding protein
MNRRSFLSQAGIVAGTAVTFPVPAIAQGIRELKLATSWPKDLPGLSSSAERIGQGITAASGNRLQVKVFAAGELVKPIEVFDAVSSGVVDMYHSVEYYW